MTKGFTVAVEISPSRPHPSSGITIPAQGRGLFLGSKLGAFKLGLLGSVPNFTQNSQCNCGQVTLPSLCLTFPIVTGSEGLRGSIQVGEAPGACSQETSLLFYAVPSGGFSLETLTRKRDVVAGLVQPGCGFRLTHCIVRTSGERSRLAGSSTLEICHLHLNELVPLVSKSHPSPP